MRIVVAVELRRFAQSRVLGIDECLGDGEGGSASGELFEHFRHPAFEVQAVVENGVGAAELLDIGRRLAIQMRIDARSHQGGHFDMLAANVSEHVGHLPGRADDLDRVVAGEGLGDSGGGSGRFAVGMRLGAATGQNGRQKDCRRPKTQEVSA